MTLLYYVSVVLFYKFSALTSLKEVMYLSVWSDCG